jgi:L-amino acid N-acyltransferase YncA
MTCIGQVENGILRAVVGYDHFTGKSCQMHVAGTGKTWMTRELLFAVFDYPFRELGLNVVLGIVDSSNADGLAFNRRIGFREVHRVVNGHPDGDLVIFEMQKADCRWLSLRSRLKWERSQATPLPITAAQNH